ncbi:MAG: hypothetical protein CFE24_10725 [Flavobacterium sp. BFFFF2]|nr:MAG: hypothetical protein CFE24_10725 [Flavobacterium sp. BFFFF2]
MKTNLKLFFGLFISSILLSSCTAEKVEKDIGTLSISQITSSTADYSEFHKALVLTGLIDVINNGNVTVFVPKDDQLKSQLGRSVQQQEDLDHQKLVDVIKYYIVPTILYSSQFVDNAEFTTSFNSIKLKITLVDDGYGKMIPKVTDIPGNQNQVLAYDVNCTNGRLFPIDGYLSAN